MFVCSFVVTLLVGDEMYAAVLSTALCALRSGVI